MQQITLKPWPGFKWTKTAMSAGLAGGAYFRREAILDAFSDENMMKLDWNMRPVKQRGQPLLGDGHQLSSGHSYALFRESILMVG